MLNIPEILDVRNFTNEGGSVANMRKNYRNNYRNRLKTSTLAVLKRQVDDFGLRKWFNLNVIFTEYRIALKIFPVEVTLSLHC